MTVNQCPLCGGPFFSEHRSDLLRCKGCGIVLDRNVWKETSNADLEKEWFDENFNTDRSCWVAMFESWGNKRTWRRISPFLHKSGMRLLEIGVGSGSLLGFMKERGFDVSGCDLSKTICKHVQQTYAVPMYDCSVSDLPSKPVYDVVVMNHVLEHVNDPLRFLSDVREKLTDKGVLHIAVPNVNSCEARLAGWTSYEPYHLVYFTPATLKQVVKQAGFKILKVCTHESFSGWFLVIIRALLKTHKASAGHRLGQKKRRADSWLEHSYRICMVLFGGLTFPLRFVQGMLGYGDEVIILARPAGNEKDGVA